MKCCAGERKMAVTVEINREVFYTPSEYAALMRYSDARPVWRAIQRGDIPAVSRLDRRYLIPAWYVERVIKNTGGFKWKTVGDR
jgi:hypothetical protein